MQVVEAPRAKSQPLAEQYINGFNKVAGRFDYNPWQQEEWERRWTQLQEANYPHADRRELAKILAIYNEETGNIHDEVTRHIRLLEQEGTVVVVGGQQAGLFTGPLLVIHKAISVIRMAREAQARLGRNVVPVFWIAGEDHDFAEVNHWYALTGQTNIERFRLEHPTGQRTAVSRVQFESWTQALDQMDQWLPNSDFKAELMSRLTELGEQSRNLSDYFARIISWLFGSYGLVLLDSNDARLRKLEAPMFRKLLTESQAFNASVLEGVHAVARLGFTPQADQAPGNVNLFFYDEKGERTLLQKDGSGFTDRKHSFIIQEQELLKILQEQPDRFSNNVMTRPLMQDYLLPVLGTVLGPGEIAYWSLTKEAFHQAGMSMPLVLPRLEFTLVEGALQKNMDKFGIRYDDVMDRFDELRNSWLAEQGQEEMEKLFLSAKQGFEELYQPVLQTVSGLNPGLAKLAETNRQKIIDQVDFLRTKAMEGLENKFSTGLRQLERIQVGLCPLSKPQERVYNVFAYLNKYGTSWMDELITASFENDGGHRLVCF